LKAYALLRRTLEDSERTAIVNFALRQKTRLGALRVRGDVLVLQTLLWNDEVREASFPSLADAPRITQRELDLSSALMESFAGDFQPEKFSDEYQDELRKLIDAKLEQGDTIDTAETFGEQEEKAKGGGEVIDLMEALQRSVERSRGSGGRSGAKGDADDEKAAAKKPGAKSAKSSTSKSGTSKSSTARSGTAKSAAKKPAAKTAAKKPA
jgi:DNA end-binding protein Ku